MGFLEKFRRIIEESKHGKSESEEDFERENSKVHLNDDFSGPIHEIPRNRTEVFQVYGKAPKDKRKLPYESAEMTVAKNLPGRWNGHKDGKGKLYMHVLVEDYFREALNRCISNGTIKYIKKIGCYNHRHQRHDQAMPLSYHSWGIAFDINPKQNNAVYTKNMSGRFQPFSREWNEYYREGVPLGLIEAFTSVGFKWGGDWGRDYWKQYVAEFGEGYNVLEPKTRRIIQYTDPMHFELVA